MVPVLTAKPASSQAARKHGSDQEPQQKKSATVASQISMLISNTAALLLDYARTHAVAALSRSAADAIDGHTMGCCFTPQYATIQYV
jgi:hypothetical protein